MEDVKSYIESGILELYVLGQLTAKENKEVEDAAAKYPEVKAEISAIEVAMENYALENSVAASVELESKILSQFKQKADIDNGETIKVVPLYDNRQNEVKLKVMRYALIACIALLVVCVASLYSLNNKLDTAHEQIATLNASKEQFTKTVSRLQFEKAGMENRIAMTETSEWRTVKLAGLKDSPDSKMLVYWNKNNKNILINYSALNLPDPGKAHEYQLWALVDGKPVSLGVFGTDAAAKEAVKEMDAIERAQAFAVTIEPLGGSVNPTMDKMVVMGTI